ncbi:S-adenosyl-L-methionine-dependent methyltransferase [Artomyces pyxidatus]|uniref:S-adenosyl-L-methionine-dependent methyltransferase n=1 Tax=Artomyces pyxidatus TaxID=48021 RepID=A0ACB8TL27_9AGAM|nr:S-adenosyl-L-methionine-dependent methyltransferase [Artomyces pyxidatus]
MPTDAADPLSHLRTADDDDSDDDDAIIPAQPPSVIDQRIVLTVPAVDAPIAIQLAVDATPGCGGVAWPAGEVLARHLARRGALAGKNVLELGSGTGLVGLVAARLGAAHVCITDQAPLLQIMQTNIGINGLEANVSAAELNWGEALPNGLVQPDVVLAADCVYFEPAFPLLVQTLCDLTAHPPAQPEVLFCYKKRRKADKRFFALLKKHFTWTDVDDAERAVYTRESISLLALHRRPHHAPASSTPTSPTE